jgi:hypothetical protein
MENEKKLNIIGIIIKVIIIAPALIAGLLVMGSGVNADSPVPEQQTFMDSLSFSAAMNISFITIIAAVVLILAFFVILLVSRPKTAIKSVLGIIVAALVFFILYGIGSSDTEESLQLAKGISASDATLDFTQAGIYTALLGLVVCSVLAFFMGFIVKLIRN